MRVTVVGFWIEGEDMARYFVEQGAEVVVSTLRVPESRRAAQAELLREIFVHPFRSVQAPSARAEESVALAQAIYDEGTFDRLPALAELLEREGGWGAEAIEHCRRAGGHLRGCWVVDMILGKE